MLVVQALAGILLEMQPGDADLARRPVRHVQHDLAAADDRLLVLRDLIAGRQVGVEVVLAVEDAFEPDLGVETEPGLDRLLDAKPVDHRQHARESGVDRRDLGVRLGAEIGRRPRKQLGLRDHLGVDLEPDHGLPRPSAAVDHDPVPQPNRPLRPVGGEGGDPSRSDGEGEVGAWRALWNPPPHPNPLRPEGRRGRTMERRSSPASRDKARQTSKLRGALQHLADPQHRFLVKGPADDLQA